MELGKERKAREGVEERIRTLEAEKARVDAKRSQELEKKQSVISTLEAHKSKQAATLMKLKDEIAEFRSAAQGSRALVTRQEERIKLLEGNVEVETLARQAALAEVLSVQHALEGAKAEREGAKASIENESQACEMVQAELLSTRRALDDVRAELEDAKAARESALADAKSIEAQLGFLTSEGGKKEIIDSYRHGPVGKAELSLAIKADFDFLRARLPPSVSESVAVPYPSRVQSYVKLLEDLEARGGGV